MLAINSQSFYKFTKNGDSGATCHNSMGVYDKTTLDELVQGSLGSMSAMKTVKPQVSARQVNGRHKVHILWPLKYCAKAGANHFLLTCKLLQGGKLCSDEKNNVVMETIKNNIILDH